MLLKVNAEVLQGRELAQERRRGLGGRFPIITFCNHFVMTPSRSAWKVSPHSKNKIGFRVKIKNEIRPRCLHVQHDFLLFQPTTFIVLLSRRFLNFLLRNNYGYGNNNIKNK